MRYAVLIVAALAAHAGSALADENFIPLGQAYSPESDTLPPLNSDRDLLNAQVDVEEAATWVRDRDRIIFSSRERQIVSDQRQVGPSGFIDY